MIYRSGHSSNIKPIRYLFIDGGYLDKVLESFSKEFFNSHSFDLDYSKIGLHYDKVFYYHALPGRGHNEPLADYEERINIKEEYFNKLKLINNFHVYEGVTYGKAGRIRQKGVDVKIAVDMLKHTLNNNMNKATLLAGDMDFKPLLDSLIQEGMNTTLLYHKQSISNELLYSADIAQPISLPLLKGWLNEEFLKTNPLPNGVHCNVDKNGLTPIFKLEFKDRQTLIYKTNENSFVAEIKREGSNQWLIFSFHDLEILKKYLIYEYDLVNILPL